MEDMVHIEAEVSPLVSLGSAQRELAYSNIELERSFVDSWINKLIAAMFISLSYHAREARYSDFCSLHCGNL